MTLTTPRRVKNPPQGVKTVQQSRMTREEALDALDEVQGAIAAHTRDCAACSAAHLVTANGFALWHACEQGRVMLRTQLALNHRLWYLKSKAKDRKGTRA